jgi:hypothetical protein
MKAVFSFYKRSYEHLQEKAGKCGPFHVEPPELEQCEMLLVLRPDTAEISLCRKILRMYAYYACAAQMCGTKQHADELSYRAQLAAAQAFDAADADIACSLQTMVGFYYQRADVPRSRMYNLLAIEAYRASQLQLSDPMRLLAEFFRLRVTQDVEEQSVLFEQLYVTVHQDEFAQLMLVRSGGTDRWFWLVRWSVLCWEHRIWRQTGRSDAPRILRGLADCQAAMHRLKGDQALNEAMALAITAAGVLAAGQPTAALATLRAFAAHTRALNLKSEVRRATPVFAYALEAAMYVAGHFRLAEELEELLQLMRALMPAMPFCTLLCPLHEATLSKLTLSLEAASPPWTGAPASATAPATPTTDYSSAWEDALAALGMSVPSPQYALLQSADE